MAATGFPDPPCAMSSSLSSNVTFHPELAKKCANEQPAMPAPMIKIFFACKIYQFISGIKKQLLEIRYQ